MRSIKRRRVRFIYILSSFFFNKLIESIMTIYVGLGNIKWSSGSLIWIFIARGWYFLITHGFIQNAILSGLWNQNILYNLVFIRHNKIYIKNVSIRSTSRYATLQLFRQVRSDPFISKKLSTANLINTMQIKQHAMKKTHIFETEQRLTRDYFLWWQDLL